jgi:hypothetical protein
VSTQRLEATRRDDRSALEGLEDLFKWAAETMSDGEQFPTKRVREQKMRRQVMEMVQREREQRAMAEANQEISQLHKQVIGLQQRLQETTEENACLKQTIVAQCLASQDKHQREQQELLGTIARLKKDRDYFDDLLRVNEEENNRLAELLLAVRAELRIKSRRWWHLFWPPRAKSN